MSVATSIEVLDRTVYTVSRLGATSLWGQHVTRGNVTYFVGETSAGKTVFLHNLAYRLSVGRPFLGITPPSALKVLYIDYESNDELLLEHLSTIGTSENWHFFNIGTVKPGPALLAHITGLIVSDKYDVVVFDPLVEAFPVVDENNNPEATHQMLAFRAVARSTGAGIVVVHNSGRREFDPKANNKFLGRGATARQDRADVGINWVAKGPKERVMQVAKSRTGNLGAEIVVQFDENLGYEVISKVDGMTNAPFVHESKAALVLTLCEKHPSLTHYQIWETERPTLHEAGISRSSYYRVLAANQCYHKQLASGEGSPSPS